MAFYKKDNRLRAEWKEDGHCLTCSHCGVVCMTNNIYNVNTFKIAGKPNFCPNCGADMKPVERPLVKTPKGR